MLSENHSLHPWEQAGKAENGIYEKNMKTHIIVFESYWLNLCKYF